MPILMSQIEGIPILSILNGYAVGQIGAPIIKRENLEVVAFRCRSSYWDKKSDLVVLTKDIREITQELAITDSAEDIVEASEIVRLSTLLKEKFELIGIAVASQSGQALGKIEDFTLNPENFLVQKLYVKQHIIRNLLLDNLIIDRNQIVEVKPKKIIVRDGVVPLTKLSPAPLPSLE